MKTITTLTFLFISTVGHTMNFNIIVDSKYDEPVNQSINAILAYPHVKKAKKIIQKKIYRRIPLEKETLTILGSTTATVIKGEVDTKVIKKMDFDFAGGRMRPNMKYNYLNRTISSSVNVNWTW